MLRDKQIYKDAAIRLKARREAKSISVPELANKLGVSTARYRTWEKIFGPLPQRQYGDAINRILLDCEVPPAPGSRRFTTSLQSRLRGTWTPGQVAPGIIGIKQILRGRPYGHERTHAAALGRNLFRIAAVAARRTLGRMCFSSHAGGSATLPRLPPTFQRGQSDSTDAGFLSVAEEIRAVGAWLTRSRVATRTWDFNELSKQEQRRAVMFADRYGVSGEDNTTLQVIGDRLGLTRERVRQVIEVMTDRASAHFDLPRLAQLKAEASSHQHWVVSKLRPHTATCLGACRLLTPTVLRARFWVSVLLTFPSGHSVRPTIHYSP